MNEVLTLFGELFLIACVQAVINMFIDAESMPNFAKVSSIACYAGSLFILLQFVFDKLMPQIFNIFHMAF